MGNAMTTVMAARGRLTGLDGLRGLAAMVVVLHHSLLTIPAFAQTYSGGDIPPGLAAVVLSPLDVLWAGREAVYVFFVLSGLVLTLPVASRPRYSWASYYPSRLLRLYVPVAAAVLLTVAIVLLVPRTSGSAHSDWVGIHDIPLTWRGVLGDVVLLGGTDAMNTPLWSLRWEVVFSLLLPLYVWVALRLRRLWWLVGPALLAVGAVGGIVDSLSLRVLPLFAVGCLIAANLDELRALAERLDASRARRWWGPAVLVVALLALSANGWTRFLGLGPRGHLDTNVPFLDPILYLGAALLVILAVVWAPFQSFLTVRGLAFLGAISFSLYLTHEPIIVSFALLLPPALVWLAPVIGIPVAIALAWAFFRLVERPAHRLSRAVGRAVSNRTVRTPVGADNASPL